VHTGCRWRILRPLRNQLRGSQDRRPLDRRTLADRTGRESRSADLNSRTLARLLKMRAVVMITRREYQRVAVPVVPDEKAFRWIAVLLKGARRGSLAQNLSNLFAAILGSVEHFYGGFAAEQRFLPKPVLQQKCLMCRDNSLGSITASSKNLTVS
jgi:hypothetical protein